LQRSKISDWGRFFFGKGTVPNQKKLKGEFYASNNI